jgi:hypothetical protein
MSLIKKFDFTKHSDKLSFTYKIWYDLEKDYDFLYLISSYDGENWNIIETPAGTDEDTAGNNYGWGYNGSSGNEGLWIKESVDVSRFAGAEVYLGFMYLTDAGVNGEGALIDDIYIPETGYYQDFEDGLDDWEADGFVRVSKQIPQSFELALIRLGSQPSVEKLVLSNSNEVEIELKANESIVLVIVGTSRYTHQPAVYNLETMK